MAQLKDLQLALDSANALIERQRDEQARLQEQLSAAQTRITLFDETMAEALSVADQRRIAEVGLGPMPCLALFALVSLRLIALRC
jgi:hypothetical protein